MRLSSGRRKGVFATKNKLWGDAGERKGCMVLRQCCWADSLALIRSQFCFPMVSILGVCCCFSHTQNLSFISELGFPTSLYFENISGPSTPYKKLYLFALLLKKKEGWLKFPVPIITSVSAQEDISASIQKSPANFLLQLGKGTNNRVSLPIKVSILLQNVACTEVELKKTQSS